MKARIAQAMGAEVASLRPLHGGDLSEVFAVTLTDRRRLVAKQGPQVGTEARMLTAMAAAGANAPQVLWQGGDLLLLQHLPETRPSATAWQALGQTLRRLHDAPCPALPGWDEDHAFGPLRIDNAPRADWPTFWAEARLAPFTDHLPRDVGQRLGRLQATLPDRLRDAPTALLHGDLWTGNALFTQDNAWLIDPASYRGDPEVDLALLQFFGTPPQAFWQGYGPRRPGWRSRCPVYQLYPALVHLALFGKGYLPLVERLLDESLASP